MMPIYVQHDCRRGLRIKTHNIGMALKGPAFQFSIVPKEKWKVWAKETILACNGWGVLDDMMYVISAMVSQHN